MEINGSWKTDHYSHHHPHASDSTGIKTSMNCGLTEIFIWGQELKAEHRTSNLFTVCFFLNFLPRFISLISLSIEPFFFVLFSLIFLQKTSVLLLLIRRVIQQICISQICLFKPVNVLSKQGFSH